MRGKEAIPIVSGGGAGPKNRDDIPSKGMRGPLGRLRAKMSAALSHGRRALRITCSKKRVSAHWIGITAIMKSLLGMADFY